MPRPSNPKRRIQRDPSPQALKDLASRVKYGGNPYHKRNPGDFKLTPPALPQPDKTLCDLADITTKREALRLLKSGVQKGLVSRQTRGGFPQNIWAVREEDSFVFEAQLENQGLGTYHGYPMSSNDDFRFEVLKKWFQ